MAVTAIAKGLTSLGGWMSKKSKKKKARDKLHKLRDDVMAGKVGVEQEFEGSMELADESTNKALDQLSEAATNKLSDIKDAHQNVKQTFAGSGADERSMLKAEGSMWDTFLTSADNVRDKGTREKMGAYGRLGAGAKNIESQYDDLMGQINKLT